MVTRGARAIRAPFHFTTGWVWKYLSKSAAPPTGAGPWLRQLAESAGGGPLTATAALPIIPTSCPAFGQFPVPGMVIAFCHACQVTGMTNRQRSTCTTVILYTRGLDP